MNSKCTSCGFSQCLCDSWCPSRQLGCCNSENSAKQCAGPVHLTAQWDIGSRPCCPYSGQKYSAMGGLLNFCSVNGGREHPTSEQVLAPYPMAEYATILSPADNRGPGINTRGNRFPGFSGDNGCDTKCSGFTENYTVRPCLNEKLSRSSYGIR